MATTKCSVWRPKKYVFMSRDDPWATREDFESNHHEWRKNGETCDHCGLTRAETQYKEPKAKVGQLAREIAGTPADVPPVYFHGTPGARR